MDSRVISKCNFSPLRSISKDTVVPASPRIREDASSTGISVVDCPSIAIMWSPGLIPALKAGWSSITLTAYRPLSSVPRTIPTPAYVADVCIFMDLYSSAFK